MAFIFTNLVNDFQGRRPRLEDYLNGLGTSDQEQIATDAGITFTPSSDIDVATQEDYESLAVEADEATYFDYSAVPADVRDKYEEEAIAAFLPEDKAALAANSAVSNKVGPVFVATGETVYLTVMLAKYPGWSKLIYESAIPAGEREAAIEDFIMQMSGQAKGEFAKAVPTGSYDADAAFGLYSVANSAEYAGIMQQVFALIKKKK